MRDNGREQSGKYTVFQLTKPDQDLEVKEILDLVYNAMEEKGYNPVNQIVGYIMLW